MINKELQSKIENISNLPTLPTVVIKVMKIVNDPSTSASDVAFVVGQDISLSAKILRLANSAFYGIPKAVTNLNNAVVILGLKVINTIVLSLTIFDMFPKDRKTPLFNRTAFWRHCTSCGLICKFLSARLKKFILFDSEDAFCAGLLHDIGKIVMEQYLHDDFRNALKFARQKKIPFFEAEIKTLGYSHTDVADWLTSQWQLPSQLLAPIIYHHTPKDTQEYLDIVALCHVADYLCYELKLSIDEEYSPPLLDPTIPQMLGISQEDIEALRENLVLELDKVNVFCEIGGV